MRHLISALVSTLFFSTQAAASSHLFNVGIRVDMKYEAFGETCHLRALFRHFNLSAEIKDDLVTRAMITKLNTHGPAVSKALTQPELSDLIIKTEQDLSWVRSMVVSQDILQTLIHTGAGLSKYDCQPPKDLVYETLDPVHFDFEVDSVGYLLPHLIHSKPVIIRGHKSNGDPFRIQLILTQDRT